MDAHNCSKYTGWHQECAVTYSCLLSSPKKISVTVMMNKKLVVAMEYGYNAK